jgi:hypothetical protein
MGASTAPFYTRYGVTKCLLLCVCLFTTNQRGVAKIILRDKKNFDWLKSSFSFSFSSDTPFVIDQTTVIPHQVLA